MRMNNDAYQRLGHRAYYFFVAEKSKTPLIFFVITIVLAIMRGAAQPGANPQIETIVGIGALAGLILFIITLAIAFWLAFTQYVSVRFRFDDDGISVKRGIVSEEEVTLPFRQIQSIDINQSLFYRMFGVCELVISTAGQNIQLAKGQPESQIVLPALDIVRARALQSSFLARVGVQEVVNVPAAAPNQQNS
jgi:uncharacterized membrane protein YdbT with pleckstrin-like domain